MIEIKSSSIYTAVKELCFTANTKLPKYEYFKLLDLYENETNDNAKNVLEEILLNVKLADENKRPLCQDTGFVTALVEIGQNVKIIGENISQTINKAVADAYTEFFFRKSTVKSFPDRINTGDNTPVLIHTDIVDGDEISITLAPKGGGCENVSSFKMLSPGANSDEIIDFVVQTVKNASSKPCPPIRIGIGIGSNFEGSAILSKKALITEKSLPEFENLEHTILEKVNNLGIGAMGLGGSSTCFDVKILNAPCHIASLPVSISISCHSSRHATAIIKEDKVEYLFKNYECANINSNKKTNVEKINVSDVEKIKNLKPDTKVLLSGKIYTARDAAHKKFTELIKNNKSLPFELKDAIIFYAGPCPANDDEIIGPIGPTTSARMDIFTPELYKRGLLATIGKGNRNEEVIDAIKCNNGKYFTVTGGVASLLKNCVKSAKTIAYPELGAEAVFELEVENLPLIVKF